MWTKMACGYHGCNQQHQILSLPTLPIFSVLMREVPCVGADLVQCPVLFIYFYRVWWLTIGALRSFQESWHARGWIAGYDYIYYSQSCPKPNFNGYIFNLASAMDKQLNKIIWLMNNSRLFPSKITGKILDLLFLSSVNTCIEGIVFMMEIYRFVSIFDDNFKQMIRTYPNPSVFLWSLFSK